MTSDRITVFGPASLSNLGPGFDALGLCITGPGDHIEARVSDTSGVTIHSASSIPTDPAKNTAGRAALDVLRRADATIGLELTIHKGIPLGSGIGGSAASAVAAAWAANEVLGRPFTKRQLVGSVLEGEHAASHHYHGDNVLPALFGGLVLVSPSDPTDFRPLVLADPPEIVIVLPRVEVLTRQARAVLPATVLHGDASAQAAELAFLLTALRDGDWESVGRHLMRDRLAEPHRARLVPVYQTIRQAALDAGSWGCALTGSGPAMFALPGASASAKEVLDAMLAASRTGGVDADGWVASVDVEGVRALESPHPAPLPQGEGTL
ncbi:MAG: homoserine kinase [Bacteroidota bacterium]